MVTSANNKIIRSLVFPYITHGSRLTPPRLVSFCFIEQPQPLFYKVRQTCSFHFLHFVNPVLFPVIFIVYG